MSHLFREKYVLDHTNYVLKTWKSKRCVPCVLHLKNNESTKGPYSPPVLRHLHSQCFGFVCYVETKSTALCVFMAAQERSSVVSLKENFIMAGCHPVVPRITRKHNTADKKIHTVVVLYLFISDQNQISVSYMPWTKYVKFVFRNSNSWISKSFHGPTQESTLFLTSLPANQKLALYKVFCLERPHVQYAKNKHRKYK